MFENLETILGKSLQEAEKKRHVFFSFHYGRDIWRANQVRKHGVIKRSAQAVGHYDHSLWEEAKTKGSVAIKELIDEGLTGASVTCVLIGLETYTRPWCDYEILRSLEMGKGVFGVRIHGLESNSKETGSEGPNLFDYLGLFWDTQLRKFVSKINYKNGWRKHDKVESVLASRVPYVRTGTDAVLSRHLRVYDWCADQGYEHFDSWAAEAARQAGR